MAGRRAAALISVALTLTVLSSPPAAGSGATRAPACAAGHVKISLGPPVSPMTGEHADLFELTTRSTTPCILDGYPRVSLSHHGTHLAFVYLNGGGMYVTTRKPQPVTLRRGRPAYFLVAKYRCDGGVLSTATTIRVQLPGMLATVTLRLSGPGVGGLEYCKRYPGDQPVDPGNRVAVSPVEASPSPTMPTR